MLELATPLMRHVCQRRHRLMDEIISLHYTYRPIIGLYQRTWQRYHGNNKNNRVVAPPPATNRITPG